MEGIYEGLGFRAQGLGFRAWFGLSAESCGFRAQGVGSWPCGLGRFRV